MNLDPNYGSGGGGAHRPSSQAFAPGAGGGASDCPVVVMTPGASGGGSGGVGLPSSQTVSENHTHKLLDALLLALALQRGAERAYEKETGPGGWSGPKRIDYHAPVLVTLRAANEVLNDAIKAATTASFRHVPRFETISKMDMDATGLQACVTTLDKDRPDLDGLKNAVVRIDGAVMLCKGVDSYKHAPPFHKGETAVLHCREM